MRSLQGAGLRSISGRLYAAIGLLGVALVATNAMTIVYSDTVADGARHAHESVRALQAADEFDELLDQHRRAVTAEMEAGGASLVRTETELAGMELRLAEIARESGKADTLATDPQSEIVAHVAQLSTVARTALGSAATAGPSDHAGVTQAAVDFYAYVNEVEEDVTAWKTRAREANAAELALMCSRANAMHAFSFAVTGGACLLVLAGVLLSRGVLARLQRLTGSMLALAAGNVETEVPFQNDQDEIGQLSAAVEVFREHAQRSMTSEANLTAALESMIEAIAIYSADGRIVLHNQKFIETLRLPRRDCRGMTADDVIRHLLKEHDWPVEAIADIRDRMATVRARGGADTFDVDLPDLRSYTITATTMPNGKLLVSTKDVSERRAFADRIFHLAHHDVLTGLPNRAAFQERLGLAVEDALSADGFGVTLLLCDLDHFKEVNDTYGHPAGDELLRQAAARIRETMRRTDILARLGGDEFAIIHLSGTEPREAHALADRIVTALKQPFDIQSNKVCIGVSVGIACAPMNAASPVDLLKQADLALYAAKQGGRDMYMVFDAGMAERFAERRALEAEMRLALEAGGFELHYQPQVDLNSRGIIGFEALARWNHPMRGPVPPSVFIPIAEQCGLIIKFGEWVLRTACYDAVKWGGDTSIAVNVASQQFRHEGFVDLVIAVLRDTGLPPHRLELEVTETAMLNDGEQMLSVLHRLRSLGVRLSMDDFGTGYSALNYLQKFPFDKIKIDQSFVHGLGNSSESDAIVRAVAALGVNLGITTLAEGVETESQARRVFNAACGEAQGYLFGRAVPASEISALLEEAEHTIAA